MADIYKDYIVNAPANPKPGAKLALPPLFLQLGCTNINTFSKNDLIEIAAAYNETIAPLYLESPAIQDNASQAHKAALVEMVDARKKVIKAKGKIGTEKATTAQPRKNESKNRSKVQNDEITPDDDEAEEKIKMTYTSERESTRASS